PAWKPVAMLAELINDMMRSSTPSPMRQRRKPSPMSEFRSIRVFNGHPWRRRVARLRRDEGELCSREYRSKSSIFRYSVIKKTDNWSEPSDFLRVYPQILSLLVWKNRYRASRIRGFSQTPSRHVPVDSPSEVLRRSRRAGSHFGSGSAVEHLPVSHHD